jgi:GNAT superfamily N-acetyltransferase
VWALPQFFGIDEGVFTVAPRLPTSAEITWMAVDPRQRRQGRGGALLDHAADRLRGDGVTLLHVLTLAESERETGDDTYEGTRASTARTASSTVRAAAARWVQRAVLLARPLIAWS